MPASRYPIHRYLSTQMAYGPAFTQDGAAIAFTSTITGVPQIWRVELPGADGVLRWPDQLTFGTERALAVRAPRVPGDNRLLYGRDRGGNENVQLFLREGAEEMALTAGHEDAMHITAAWTPDAQRLVFAANRRDRGLFDVHTYDLTTGEVRLVFENDTPGFLFELVCAPDGNRAAVMRMRGSFDTDLLEIDLQGGGARLISPEERGVRYASAVYGPDSLTVYLVTDHGTDFLYLARLDTETQTLESLVAPEWDVEGVAVSPDGGTLVYSVNVEGASSLHALDLASGAVRDAPVPGGAPGVLLETPVFAPAGAPDGGRVAFAYSPANRTYDIYLWDLGADQVYPVTRSAHGGLPVESFYTPELVRYPTFDTDPATGGQRTIPAWLYRPDRAADAAETPLPVVVIVHGGPEGQSRPALAGFAQYLLHNGYALLMPNVRGSVGYGKAYSHLDDVEKRMDSVADLAHAAHWLKAQPEFDGERIAVYGGSYGGFMVLSALTTYPDLWVAGVDIVGISNFVTFLENTSAYRRSHREAEYGSLERDRDFLESISPSNHLEKITAPLMVIHGANDPRVPLSEAEQIVEALRARDVPVEYLVFDDEGHGIALLKNKLVAYPAIVDFLDRVMGAAGAR